MTLDVFLLREEGVEGAFVAEDVAGSADARIGGAGEAEGTGVKVLWVSAGSEREEGRKKGRKRTLNESRPRRAFFVPVPVICRSAHVKADAFCKGMKVGRGGEGREGEGRR